ncbi:MAG: hypothetical protein CMN78_02315 [Spirochaetales bacterium]|nr:hypothetical protein [Spirochaetales bacterium]
MSKNLNLGLIRDKFDIEERAMKKCLLVIIVLFFCLSAAYGQTAVVEEDERNEWSVDSINGRLANSLFVSGNANEASGSIVIETTVSNSAIATLRFDEYDLRFLMPESIDLDPGYLSDEELAYPSVSALSDGLDRGLILMARAYQEISVPIRERQRNGMIGETVVDREININKTAVLSEMLWESTGIGLKVLFDIRGTANTSKIILNVEIDTKDALFIELDSITANALYEILTIDTGNQFTIMRAMLNQVEGDSGA